MTGFRKEISRQVPSWTFKFLEPFSRGSISVFMPFVRGPIIVTEPIGEEHSNEEIAEAFLNTVNCSATIGGVMARVPVKGTPFARIPILNEEKLAHIVAVLRLSGGDVVKDICTHPATLSIMNSGANVLVVEAGAIPRDTNFTIQDWRNTTMQAAKELLIASGYEL